VSGIYKYDVDDLTQTARGLRTLHSDFSHASEARRGAAGAMGYDDLRGAVEDFVDNWEHNRTRQLEAIDAAAQALDGILTDYVDGDEGAAAQLRSGGPS
jgi:hypothetical protein